MSGAGDDKGENIHSGHLAARLNPSKSLAAQAMNGKTVRMSFPKNIGVTLTDQSQLKFERTPQDDPDVPFVRDVPEDLANSNYLKAAGAKLAE